MEVEWTTVLLLMNEDFELIVRYKNYTTLQFGQYKDAGMIQKE